MSKSACACVWSLALRTLQAERWPWPKAWIAIAPNRLPRLLFAFTSLTYGYFIQFLPRHPRGFICISEVLLNRLLHRHNGAESPHEVAAWGAPLAFGCFYSYLAHFRSAAGAVSWERLTCGIIGKLTATRLRGEHNSHKKCDLFNAEIWVTRNRRFVLTRRTK